MIRVAVCDDDKLFAGNLERLIMEYFGKRLIKCDVEVFYDGSTLEEEYRKSNRFDIIYLDIEMDKMNGIEAAKLIRNIDRNVVIIYVSNYDTYFLELFEVEPFRFIKKPINLEKFDKITQMAYERVIEEDAYFEYMYNKEYGKVLVRDIVYFESIGRVINIVTDREVFKFYGKLDEVEKRLKNHKIPFLRIHKSFYVNFNHVDKITYSKVILYCGAELKISDERQAGIRKRYMEILEKSRV